MNSRKCWLSVLALSAFMAGMSVVAQTNAGDPQGVQQEKVAALVNALRATATGEQSQTSTFTFVASEGSFDSKVVKGAPFSADTVTAFNQTLSNGQHIARKSTSSLYRDSEGRTRREQTIDLIGPYGAATARKTVFINDPVAMDSYTLDPENHTGTKNRGRFVLPVEIPKEIPQAGARAVLPVE